MPKLHIDEICDRVGTNPTICNFQNGYTTDLITNHKCVIQTNVESGKELIAMEIDNIVYVGEEQKEDLGRNFLLVRNKNTGKVRIVEMGYVELKPIVEGKSKSSQSMATTDLELSRKFGSKKQIKKMEQKEKLKLNVETVQEQMKSVSMNTTIERADISEYMVQDTDEFYIPPIDRTATAVQHVYDTNKILNSEQYEKIHSEIESKDIEEEYHPFVKNIIKDKKLTMQENILALYASGLLSLYVKPMKDIVKNTFVAIKASSTLNEIIMNNFFQNVDKKRLRPPMYKDKALCHALVFMLLLNNFKINLDSFAKEAKLTTKTIMMKIKVTGASIVSSGSNKIIQLKLPLASASAFKLAFNRRKSAKF